MSKRSERARAIAIGATMQAVTFVVMLLGLTYLYQPASSMAGHLPFLSVEWFFTLPWMMLNGAAPPFASFALRVLRGSSRFRVPNRPPEIDHGALV